MNFRKTRIYSRALELASDCQALIQTLPRGTGYLGDQMRRAACSITLNYAEGCGKKSRAERRRFFQMAKASAYEVAATLDIARCLGVIDEIQRERLIDTCDHIAAMLSRFEP